MRTLLFAVVLCLLASVVLSDKIWDYCGSETDTLQLKDIQVSPDQPVAGETFKVEIIGTLKSPIADGKAHVLAMFAGVKLFEGDVGICQAGLTCPIGTGPFDVAISQKIPEFAPIGGPYTGKIIMTDQTGAQITCITFKFDMQEPENKAKAMINDQAFIAEVNTKATTWQAGSNKIFDGKSVQDLQKFLGARLTNTIPSKPLKTLSNDSALPESFDSRIQWKDCVHPVRDQQRCGSCWAFAASEALSDRFCIKSKSAINLVLSPQYMVSCDKSDFGCNGGYLENAWQFLQDSGIPTEKCYPYTSGEGDSGVCKTTCADGSALKLYKTKDTNTFEGEEAIMNEIYSNGPVEAGFLVYRDFMNYKSGVYQHASGGILGGHAVKILGWGVDSLTKTNYWIVANSWGTSWGMNGFFFMKRGTNECGIEGNVVAGTPDV